MSVLFESIEDSVGELGATTIMYNAGFAAAGEFAEKLAKIERLKGIAVLKRIVKEARSRGWFTRPEIQVLSETPINVGVRMRNTIAEELGNAGRTVCHVMEGVIAGVLTYAAKTLGRNNVVIAKETKCIAKGDPYCEIVARERTA